MNQRIVASLITAAVSLAPGRPVVAQQVARSSDRAVADERAADQLLLRPTTVDLRDVTLREAIDAAAASAKVFVQYQNGMVNRYPDLVTIRADHAPLRDVLERLLMKTNLRVVADGATQVAIVPGEYRNVAAGIITGGVIDAKTKRPLRGATVLLDGATRGVSTDEDGKFRIGGVGAGEHRVTVRLLGHSRQTKVVQVVDDQSVTADFAMELSVNALDQVVVTGTVVATELKTVPNAITVITSKQIEERGITRIDQLFHGDVPGMFEARQSSKVGLLARSSTYSRGAVSMGTGEDGNTHPIKTYVDGVELADAGYLSQIDPASIARIEIVTGPQASTIYGSGAVNGVMQIFTKRGTTAKPDLNLFVRQGFVENSGSSALTPFQNTDAQVSSVEGRFSYNVGGSWRHQGAWAPGTLQTTTGGFGGVHYARPISGGQFSLDIQSRMTWTRIQAFGDGNQANDERWKTGEWRVSATPTGGGWTSMAPSQTFGMTATYAPTTWWSNELVLGRDVVSGEYHGNTSNYRNVWDTLYTYNRVETVKPSIRYSTTVNTSLSDNVRVTGTFGADTWQSLSTIVAVDGVQLTGWIPTAFNRAPSHNTGAFFTGQIGLWSDLFLTYGVRAEWNPNYGSEANPNYAPKYGVAYTRDIGQLTTKLRASYGRSTTPPTAGQKNPQSPFYGFRRDIYGPNFETVAAPYLTPEYQKGSEAGIELYWGQRLSMVVTRYNQTVDGLITPIFGADSIRSLRPNPTFGTATCAQTIADMGYGAYYETCSSVDAEGYTYIWQGRNINATNIRNQGWELQGSVNTGPLTTRGVYSWTKSRVIGITAAYAAQMYRLNVLIDQFNPGSAFQLMPEHTWALGTTYAHAGTTVALNVTGVGKIPTYSSLEQINAYSPNIRLGINRANVALDYRPRPLGMNPGYAMADLSVTHRFSKYLESQLLVQNLTNDYSVDGDFGPAVMGRQTNLGFRIRW